MRNKRFGELNIGDCFEYAGKHLVKLDDCNARTTTKTGKEDFLFFKNDLVTFFYNEPVKASQPILIPKTISDYGMLLRDISDEEPQRSKSEISNFIKLSYNIKITPLPETLYAVSVEKSINNVDWDIPDYSPKYFEFVEASQR